MDVDLYYLSPNPYGGWVTFTAHLMKSLRHVGLNPSLFKIRDRIETKMRPFGYGEFYRNITVTEARLRKNPSLIVAAAKNFKEQTEYLVAYGAGLVIHDPTELKNLPEFEQHRTVVIRKAGLDYLPKANFIRHPYCRQDWNGTVLPRLWACSVSRIDFDKQTHVLLDANRLLPVPSKIDIRGFENRIYTRFKIVPHYPEWVQSRAHYPRESGAAFGILQQHVFSVDMSEIKGDGGGTQYTTLESWDAGTIPIISANWCRKDDDMVQLKNCISVPPEGEALAGVLSFSWASAQLEELRAEGYKSLVNHSPYRIGNQYEQFLQSL